MSTAEFIFGRHGISFERTVTDGQGSELMYRTFLGLLNNGDILLPDDEELLAQLRRLEERTSDGNRFRVAGRRNSKDDLAVATVLSVSMTAAHMNASAPIVEAILSRAVMPIPEISTRIDSSRQGIALQVLVSEINRTCA